MRGNCNTNWIILRLMAYIPYLKNFYNPSIETFKPAREFTMPSLPGPVSRRSYLRPDIAAQPLHYLTRPVTGQRIQNGGPGRTTGVLPVSGIISAKKIYTYTYTYKDIQMWFASFKISKALIIYYPDEVLCKPRTQKTYI